MSKKKKMKSWGSMSNYTEVFVIIKVVHSRAFLKSRIKLKGYIFQKCFICFLSHSLCYYCGPTTFVHPSTNYL